MKIYHYSRETGEFVAENEARPDPLEKGRFLVPGFATEIEPPESGENEIAVFDGSAWELKADFRGVDYWLSHDDKHTISAIGETVPEGAFMEQPPKPEPTEDELSAAARANRDRLLSESDWIVTRSLETGDAIPPEWLSYRQALRDVPDQTGFPQIIDWPTAPDAV